MIEVAKNLLLEIGVAVVASLVYYLLTYLGAGIMNGGYADSEKTAWGGWFTGGLLFLAMALILAHALGF